MIRRLKCLLLGAVLLAGFGCTNTFDDYTPGPGEKADNYGVYFPPQATGTTLELEPESSTDVTYRVHRTRTDGEITVPCRIEASEENIFIVSPIRFADGQRETDVHIQFPRAQLGVEYTLTISIDDPAYAATYGGNSTSLTLSVVRAGWKLIGQGRWRDDIISSIYISVPSANAEVPVDIYEREDQPGMYRIKVFNQDYVKALFDGSIAYAADANNRTIIDATDPSKVWIPMQDTGLTLASEQGSIIIASNVDKIFSMDEAESQYGTLDENGVITFPIHGVIARLTGVDAEDEWRSVNSSGMLRIMLPGARLYDYSLALERNDQSDGRIGVDITSGQDVKNIKYALLEGRMDEGQVSLAAQSLDAGEMDFDGELSPAENHLALKPEATGLYTLICCTYNEAGQMQDYKWLSFGYIAEGEDIPVVLTFGLEQTNEQAGQGYDKSNSVKFYAYGEDIQSLRYALRRDDRTPQTLADAEIIDKYGIRMSSSELASINAGAYRTLFTGLNGERTYTLYIEADNGYHSQIFKQSVTTEGPYNPLLDGWSWNDFRPVNPSLYKNTILTTTYNLYGFDLLDTSGRMKFLGEVNVFDEDDGHSYDDLLNIRGIMSSIEIDDGMGEDEFHKRHLIPATDKMLPGGYDLYSVYQSPKYGLFGIGSGAMEYQNNGTHYDESIYMIYYAEETLSGYIGNTVYGNLYGMVAGEVADGCLAITPNPGYAAESMTCRFMGFVGQKSTFALYLNLVLVDKSTDIGLPKNPPTINEALNQTYESEDGESTTPWSQPLNFVEVDSNIIPYTQSIRECLQLHNRNIYAYPSVPALPEKIKKARADVEQSSGSASNGETPADRMTLRKDAAIRSGLKLRH